jgi:hypothetical protein
MAYMDQERKQQLAAELKTVMPKDWKWSLSVRHHSTLVLTIQEAPIDLMADFIRHEEARFRRNFPSDTYTPSTSGQVNPHAHWIAESWDEPLRGIFTRISKALNTGNHDRSDSMTDYFDVGWYVTINIGRWDKPFRYVPSTRQQPAGEQPVPGSSQYEVLRTQVEALKAKIDNPNSLA